MKKNLLRSDAILLSTAIIWGFAFVAQRVGMDYVGPFLFNGIRFALGCLVLIPFILKNGISNKKGARELLDPKTIVIGGALAGLTLFGGSSLQQVGIVYTTAGKAGFITGLYVVIVPFLALLWKQHTNRGTWVGAICAASGLYFLSINEEFTIDFGDSLVLLGAFCFAAHVLVIGWLSPKMNSLKLAFIQYAAVSLVSLITALIFEDIYLHRIVQAAVPILYGGVMSVGIAYTLQVIGQRKAHPAHASIILSLEAVFAALGGWLILQEVMTFRQLSGCALMLSGMLISQLWGYLSSLADKKEVPS
ncbi:MAG: DMT family transporter [Syntrophobacterales bacterium]|nr:MAG: DMT family transporter [Syntrophobacterales bacterium]